jgi:cytochrome c-type biogenesis protein
MRTDLSLWPPRLAPRSSGRIWLAAALTVGVLVIAVGAAIMTTTAASGPLVFMETVSASLSGALLALGAKAPLGYAVVAGMVASVNPCGFVLLPAYLGRYLGDEVGAGHRHRPVGRAIGVSATVTASFTVLFGIVGILAGLAASAVTSSLPWIGVAVGAGLILLGGLLAAGHGVETSLGPRIAAHLSTAARSRSLIGYAAYGTAYGLASLGCTLPVFLGVVGISLQLHGVAVATWQFILFGIGMGIVLSVLTIGTAWFGEDVVRRLQPVRRHVGWVSALLLWIAGAYVIFYWVTAIRLL